MTRSYGLFYDGNSLIIDPKVLPLRKWVPFLWKGKKYVILQPEKGVIEIYQAKRGVKDYLEGPIKPIWAKIRGKKLKK